MPLSLLIIVLLVALFGLVRPFSPASIADPGSVQLPKPTAAATLRPKPTDVHGGQIAFTCTRNDVNQICMIRADGSGYVQLTTGASPSYFPDISPDGRHVVFATNQYDFFDLYRLAPVAADQSRAAESRVKRLTDYVGNAYSPRYSPDGQKIAFINAVDNHPASLWLMSKDGVDPHLVYRPPRVMVGADWSPDGHSMAFTMQSSTSPSYDLYVLDLSSIADGPRQVRTDLRDMGGSVSWSPDQAHVLVFAGPAAAREIFEVEIDSGVSTQLTFGGNNASPDYSPDGQYIVFNSIRDDGQADLYVMRYDGHSMRRLTNDPEPDWQPRWGP